MNGEIEQQYPPQEGNAPFMYPTPPMEEFGTESSLRYQLDPDELITRIKYIMLGYDQISNPNTMEKEWKKNTKKLPLINEEGWDILEPILRGSLDKMFPMSDLENVQIENMTLGIEYNIRNLISINFLSGNNWEVRDLVTASVIKDIITNQVYATLRKAYLRGYQNFLKTIQRYTEIRNMQQRPQQQQVQQGRTGFGRIPVIGRFFG